MYAKYFFSFNFYFLTENYINNFGWIEVFFTEETTSNCSLFHPLQPPLYIWDIDIQ